MELSSNYPPWALIRLFPWALFEEGLKSFPVAVHIPVESYH